MHYLKMLGFDSLTIGLGIAILNYQNPVLIIRHRCLYKPCVYMDKYSKWLYDTSYLYK